jgi:cytochrome oxidase assembly protein ShyY1
MNIRLFNTFLLKINGFVFLFSLLVFALLIKLALWQLDRAAQKDLRLEKIELYQQQDALDLNDILNMIVHKNTEQVAYVDSDSVDVDSVDVNNEELNDLPVRLSGVFINKQSFLLDNQVYKGRLGYRVIKLFQDEISNAWVLVNLGWIQGGIDRGFIPEIAEIKGQVSFTGKIRLVESPMILIDEVLQVDTWPQRIQSIDIDKISTLLAQPLLPFVVYVDNDAPLGYIKEWVPIVMPPEKHRGYAFQWFTLAFAWLILMLTAAYKAANTNI